MPANLPPPYHEAEHRFRTAKTHEEKIAHLEEMIRLLPKHKGTEKLHAGLKTRLSKLRIQQQGKKGGAKAHSHMIPREGAGQIALVGPPNGGKSSLVDHLTHASPEVAEYPFTTREALPGMMPFRDIGFQLIDLPPLSTEYVEPWVYDLVRHADLIWVVVESTNSFDELELTRDLLAAKAIDLLHAPEQPPDDVPVGRSSKPALLVVTGCDRAGSAENLEILGELLEESWSFLSVSVVDGQGIDALKRRTFEALDIVRVYTKQPGKPPDREQPFALKRGSTVGELAKTIHKDLHEQLKFARIWGPSAFDGQTVQRDHTLEDGDVVEIHV